MEISNSSRAAKTQVFVLAIVRGYLNNSTAMAEMPADISIEEVVAESTKQKVQGIVASMLLDSPTVGGRDRSFLLTTLSSLAYERTRFLNCARIITREFAREGLTPLFRKGLIYDQLLYGGVGVRKFNDLDFFVLSKDADLATTLLKRMGFVQSDDCETAILRRICPDHLPRLTLGSSSEDGRAVAADMALNMTWYGSAGWSFSERLLGARFAAPLVESETALCTLSLEEHFLDASFHLFREGYFQAEKSSLGNHPLTLRLRQFVDIARLWTRVNHRPNGWIAEAMQLEELATAVSWVAFHTDTVLGTSLMQALGLTVDERFAYSWKRADQRLVQWTPDMIDRIFCRDPHLYFSRYSVN